MSGIDNLSHKIGSIEAKIDHLVERFESFDSKFEKTDERIQGLEKYKNYLVGIFAVISLACTLALDYVKSKLLG